MGLVNKLKNILFEEEEVEIPVLEKKEKVVSDPIIKEMPKKEVSQNVPDYSSFYNEEVNNKPMPQKDFVREETRSNVESMSERELFKSEKTFNFPSFDEEEFESRVPRRTTNVIDHEKKKLKDKNIRKVEIPKKEEIKETKTKFRPSPIISPVYGILDKNYTPEDITSRSEIPKTLDVDSVRKKAFGTLEEEIMDKPLNSNFSDVLKDKDILEEKLEKARTIDELLKDSCDEILDVEDSFNDNDYNTNEYNDFKLENTLTEVNRTMENNNIDEDLKATIDSLEDKPMETKEENLNAVEEDSLESDLFDLIDSMYENREDGE